MYKGTYIELKDFSGGLVVPANFGTSYANSGVNLELNQASDLDNIYIFPKGKGFKGRPGKAVVNTSAALNGPVVGLHYLLESGLADYTFAVAGTKIYRSSAADFTSLSDITGAVTISSDEENFWSLLTFNDAVIGFGGVRSNPDAPFIATSTGTAAALGGSPPSAYGAFTANNRVFAFATAANPSTIYWSIIGNAEDWTGAGSGNAVVGSLDDNDKIAAVALVDTNSVFIFKENSIHRMILNEAPFPIYQVAAAPGIGAVAKQAIAVIDGIIYWLSADNKIRYMAPGGEIGALPENHLLRLMNTLNLTFAFRQTGSDYDWLVFAPGSSNSNLTIVWDLKNKCYLKCSTGYEKICSQTVVVNASNLGTPNYYYGDEDGFIWQIAASSSRDTNSAGTLVPIAAYWQSGWLSYPNIDRLLQINKMAVTYLCTAAITVEYAFNYATTYTQSFTLTAGSSSTQFRADTKRLTGRGNSFRFKISLSSSTVSMSVMNILLGGKSYGQKVFGS